jgi:hypothetical protein
MVVITTSTQMFWLWTSFKLTPTYSERLDSRKDAITMQLSALLLEYNGIPRNMDTLIGSNTGAVVSLTLTFSCRYWLILSNCMVPSPSWEANNRAAETEVPFPRSKEPDTVPCPKPGKSNIYITLGSILILYSHKHLGLPNGFFSFWLSHKNILFVPLFSHVCYIPCPTYPPLFDHSNCLIL